MKGRTKMEDCGDERIIFNDETGYVLISEIIKSHIAEHNQNREVMQNCQQALQILEMLKEN
jgi:hypothetical protein